MELRDAIDFIKPAFKSSQPGSVWADLGSGGGLFTRALAMLLGHDSVIHAVDINDQPIEPTVNGNRIVFHQLDFRDGNLPFAELDGLLLANSLHFVKDKKSVVADLKKRLKANGTLIIVEYDSDKGNQWVPYPIPFSSLHALLTEAGFKQISMIGKRASLYGGRTMYACAAIRG